MKNDSLTSFNLHPFSVNDSLYISGLQNTACFHLLLTFFYDLSHLIQFIVTCYYTYYHLSSPVSLQIPYS